MEFAASLGEAGTNGETMVSLCFFDSAGTENCPGGLGIFVLQFRETGVEASPLGMRMPCVFKLETVEFEWWLSLLRGWHQHEQSSDCCPTKDV